MALTFTKERLTVEGDRHVWYGKITFDSSYNAGGEAILPGDFGLKTIDFLDIGQHAATAEWDKINSKIILRWGDYSNTVDGLLVEIPNGTDVSNIAVLAKVRGRGSF